MGQPLKCPFHNNLEKCPVVKTLFAVLAIAFCWAYHVGAWRHVAKPIRIKKHQRPVKSIFRYGFDWIRQAVFNPEEKRDQLIHVLCLLWDALTAPKSYVYQLYLMSGHIC